MICYGYLCFIIRHMPRHTTKNGSQHQGNYLEQVQHILYVNTNEILANICHVHSLHWLRSVCTPFLKYTFFLSCTFAAPMHIRFSASLKCTRSLGKVWISMSRCTSPCISIERCKNDLFVQKRECKKPPSHRYDWPFRKH